MVSLRRLLLRLLILVVDSSSIVTPKLDVHLRPDGEVDLCRTQK